MKNNSSKKKEMLPDISCKPYFIPEKIHFQCQNCGKCCRGWNLSIDSKTYQQLKETKGYKKIKKEFPSIEPLIPHPAEKKYQVNFINNGCIFLDKQNLCLVYEAKPITCRRFPFLYAVTPDGTFISASFYCKSIVENKGIPLKEYLDQIKNLQKEFYCDILVEDKVKIHNELTTNWEGYKVIEKFIYDCLDKNEDFHENLWNAMIKIIILIIDCKKKSIQSVSKDEIKKFLYSEIKLPFYRDEIYISYEYTSAMAILSLLESEDDSVKGKNIEILTDGGGMFCRNFNKEINISQILSKIKSHPLPAIAVEEFARYYKQLIWRKHLLKGEILIYGIVTLNLMYHILKWYLYASSIAQKTSEPQIQDVQSAISNVEFAIYHIIEEIILRFSKAFGDPLIKQVEEFLCGGVE